MDERLLMCKVKGMEMNTPSLGAVTADINVQTRALLYSQVVAMLVWSTHLDTLWS